MQKLEEKRNAKPNKVALLLRLVVTKPDGTILSDTGKRETKSFVIQFTEFFYGLFRMTNTSATNTTGGESSIYRTGTPMSLAHMIDAGAGVDDFGIVIGTNDGSSPEGNLDYQLDTPIAEGTGSGQMQHGAVTLTVPAVVGVNVDFDVKRVYTNGSGATITVTEVGVIVRNDQAPYEAFHLLIRDVITEVGVPLNCSLTVYYTIRTTV